MALAAGSVLGPYQIQALIGKGGMGLVYRAADARLGRNVAIKVLPEQFAQDPDRLSRFRREAYLLASLNHPHIAQIYGVEDSGNTHYLAMEFVPGLTLAERISHGPVEVEEALRIASQIADALEHAHEKGVVHRDLKPANVKVTPEGQVKVLDFGLAKAFGGDAAQNTSDSNSPTIVATATAQAIIGTAAYMSPEQAKGKAVDKRADIWAFGCLLYELLTGKQAFTGEGVSEILGAIHHKEPDWNALPQNTPPAVRTLLRRCLQKDPSRRFRDAADVRIEIEDALAASPSAAPAQVIVPASCSRRLLPWAAALGLAVITGVAAWYLNPTREPQQRPITRFVVTPPTGDQLGVLYTRIATMAVDITADAGLKAGTPKVLFEGTFDPRPGQGTNFDVTADGQRFVMVKTGPATTGFSINVILEWSEELKRRVPAGK